MVKTIFQTLMIGLTGSSLTQPEEKMLKDYCPGAVILFTRNCESAQQIADLCQHIYELCEIPPFIAIDEEGGTVSRLRKLYNPLNSISEFASNATDEQIQQYGRTVAALLRSLGINLNLAPVVDLHFNDHDNALRDRYWGDTPRDVVSRAHSFISGLNSAGLHGCLKHFPGLGRATVDSHFELPVVGTTLNWLRAEDLVPFKILRNTVPMIMMAHCSFPNISADHGLPSTVDPLFYDLARSLIDFTGIIVADDLGMKAISDHFPTEEIVQRVIYAGADMLPFCNDFDIIESIFGIIEDLAKTNPSFLYNLQQAADRVRRTKQKIRLESTDFVPDLDAFQKYKKLMESITGSGN